jgi:hypothetical protein
VEFGVGREGVDLLWTGGETFGCVVERRRRMECKVYFESGVVERLLLIVCEESSNEYLTHQGTFVTIGGFGSCG